jgi:hypothetical protein
MLLHEDKFKVISYRLNSTLNLPFSTGLGEYLTPSGAEITPSDTVRDLGVHLSNDCSWTHHVSIIAAEAGKMAAWVLGTFRDRSALTMTTLYKSMVRSKLEYCCPVWDPPKITDIQAIETVQRQFTRRISGLKDLDYWERLKKLKIMSLQRRRERYSIIQVWKILNGLSTNSTDMKFDNSDRLGVRAKLPSFNHKAQTSVSSAYDSSFGVKAPRLWNLLSKSVNTVTTLEAFKIALGGFLDQFPDRPPVPGYTTSNSNSLLAWSTVGGIGGSA